MPKHIICHLYASPQVRAWRRCVEHILARLPLWDGRKVVSIAYDEAGTRDQAAHLFAGSGIDLQFVKNDPKLGEVASFANLLEAIRNEPGQTFYCHGKGVSHPDNSVVHGWTDVMWHLNCDYPFIMEKPVAGAFMRKEYRMYVDWHYSGTFFWFRNADLEPLERGGWAGCRMTNAAMGNAIAEHSDEPDRCDVERWPARMWPYEQAQSLGLADCRNLYDEINWRSWIANRFRKEILWDADRIAGRAKAVTNWSALPPTMFEPLDTLYQGMPCTTAA